MRVTIQMLVEAGVTVLTDRDLKSVTQVGPRITSLVTTKGTFKARVFVDGTYEGDLMAAAGVDWMIGREGREQYGESLLAGKQYTLELIHFLTTDPAVPEGTRKQYARLGLCRDEFADYGHFSPALYVREGRRMQGMYVISQKDILDEPEKDDPIAVSSFPIDSHDCQRIALKGGGVINEGTWMIIGQSAGIAAAFAAGSDMAVQELPYPQLRERLLSQGQVLELPDVSEPPLADSISQKTPPGIVLDDSRAKLTGDWSRSTNFKLRTPTPTAL